jgi:hypothetical protein
MDYVTLPLEARRQIVADSLRGAETDHYRLTIREQNLELLPNLEDQIENLKKLLDELDKEISDAK